MSDRSAPEPRWVTLHEASHLSGVSEKTLRRWIHDEQHKHPLRTKTDRHGRYLVAVDDLPEREAEPEAPAGELDALRRRVAGLERRLADLEARQRVGAQRRPQVPATDDAASLQPPESPLNANPVQWHPSRRTSASQLPDGWRSAIELVMSYGKSETTARRWVLEGRKLPKPHEGEWPSGGAGTFAVHYAYDEEQQREVARRMGKTAAGDGDDHADRQHD